MTRLGLNQGTAGNVSVRYQGGMLITPTGETPFAGGQFSLLMLAVGINKDDLVFRQFFIRDAG
jgi:ribulose-5-phosphate 4-epimerase/fuculose-1-phosphate aldolase